MTTIAATIRIGTEMPSELKKMLGHHIDWLIDLDGNSDVVSSVAVSSVRDESDAGEQISALDTLIDEISSLPDASDILSAMKRKIDALLPETAN